MFVSQIKEDWLSTRLPYEFIRLLPDTCPECGSPMEITEILTGLRCSNPRCPDKIVMRIKAICEKLGVLGFGESTIRDVVTYYDVTNPLDIFNLELGMSLGDRLSQEPADKIIQQINAVKDFQLWEYVQIAQIPGVQTSAKDIFSGYSSLEDAYADIESGGVVFIQNKLGITADGELSIRAIQIYNNLIEFKQDLLDCVDSVRIISLGEKKELNIYCSDAAGGGFKHKKDFYAEINRRFGDKFYFNIAPVNKKLDCLIWIGADGTPAAITSKVAKVMEMRERGINVGLMTADQFIKYLEEQS